MRDAAQFGTILRPPVTEALKALEATGEVVRHEGPAGEILYDVPDHNQHPAIDTSASGFGHPLCGFGEETIAPNLPPTT